MSEAYQPICPARSRFLPVRGLRYHLLEWGPPEGVPLVMVHGWMDVAASFQFVVDALARTGQQRRVVAPDWRGFGLTDSPQADSYWFPDYLGDLDAVLDHLSPASPVDLLGHSMGGNVAMMYAGARPARVRRLINLEGFGVPPGMGDAAPTRLAQWLDELKTPQDMRPYDNPAGVARRLIKTNPRLAADKAAWLATRWAAPRMGSDGIERWHILGDPAHKRVNPVLSREEELLAIWRCVAAPTLFVVAGETDAESWWQGRMTLAQALARLSAVPHLQRAELPAAGHMLHHDQPEALAALVADFLR